jgi:hypothetical protein
MLVRRRSLVAAPVSLTPSVILRPVSCSLSSDHPDVNPSLQPFFPFRRPLCQSASRPGFFFTKQADRALSRLSRGNGEGHDLRSGKTSSIAGLCIAPGHASYHDSGFLQHLFPQHLLFPYLLFPYLFHQQLFLQHVFFRPPLILRMLDTFTNPICGLCTPPPTKRDRS